jgi:hypothetical protein
MRFLPVSGCRSCSAVPLIRLVVNRTLAEARKGWLERLLEAVRRK